MGSAPGPVGSIPQASNIAVRPRAPYNGLNSRFIILLAPPLDIGYGGQKHCNEWSLEYFKDG